jgi:Protein of unknown function (DUF3179)
MRKLSRAADLLRGRYKPPHTEAVDIGDMPTAEGFSGRHLLHVEEGAPLGSLSRPAVKPAAALDLADDELVLGIQRGGQSRAYPFLLLRTYHVVNDDLAGSPVTVTFCPRCFSGVAFDPVVEGTPLTFDVFGLYQGTMVMNDHQTGTIWTPLDGSAVAGRLLGRQLTMEPFEMTTLGRWNQLHPDGTAPDVRVPPKPNARRLGESRQDERLQRVVRHWDQRLHPRTLVLGVEDGELARAYVLDPSRPGPPLLQDRLGETPIVLLAAAGAWPLAYDRRAESGVLEFSLDGDRVIDESGSTWLDGRAVAGPMAGTALTFVRSHPVEWWTWAAYHPNTEIART